MAVQTFLPLSNTPDAANWAVARRLFGAFAPHAQAEPSMIVQLDQGALLNGTTLTEIPVQTVGPFVAPVGGSRVDRIVLSRATGSAAIVTGSEGALTPPAIPQGTLPIARVLLTKDTLAIGNDMLFDERVFGAQEAALGDTLEALSALDGTPGLIEQTGPAAFTKRAIGTAAADQVPSRGDADARYLQLSGGALTGALTLAGNPQGPLEATAKQYVDGAVSAVTPGAIGAAPVATTITGTGLLTGGGDLSANRTIAVADVAQNSLLGRTDAGTGAPAALSAPMVGVVTAADAPAARAVLGLGDAATRAVGASTADQVPSRGDADARYLQLSGGALTGALTLPGNPQGPLEATAKQYVDGAVSAVTPGAIGAAPVATTITGTGLLTGGGDLSANRTIAVADVAQNSLLGRTDAGSGAPAALSAPMVGVVTAADATAARTVLGLGDAATRAVGASAADQVPSRGDADARYLQLSGGALTGALTLPGNPQGPLEAASKGYVDTVAAGLDVKASVRAASTAALTLAGVQVVDGTTLAVGDRVLVKDQADAAENGVYVVAAGTWSRSADMAAWQQLPGAFLFVEEGSANADSGWVCTANAGGVLGSDPIAFTQFAGVGAFAPLGRRILAGTGLSGGGDLSADRTLSLANTAVTPGNYGSGSAAATFTVDAQGRLTGAGTAAITPAGIGAAAASHTHTSAAITDFASAVDARIAAALGGSSTDWAAAVDARIAATLGVSSAASLAEVIRDTIGATLVAGSGVVITANDTAETVIIRTTQAQAWNPARAEAGLALTNSNLTATASTGGLFTTLAYQPLTGKRYWEVRIDALSGGIAMLPGICQASSALSTNYGPASSTTGVGWAADSGIVYRAGATLVTTTNSNTVGTVVGFAFDADAGKLWLSVNGVWQASGDPATGASPVAVMPAGVYYPAVGVRLATVSGRFFAAQWSGTAPSGFSEFPVG